MEPVKLIIAALTAGATGSAESAAPTALRDAYQRLKRLVAVRFTGNEAAEAALAGHEANSEAWRAALEIALRDTGADTDPAVIDAAQRLMALCGNAGSIVGEYLLTRDRRVAGPPVDPGPPVARRPSLGRAASGPPVDPGPPVARRPSLGRAASGPPVDPGPPVARRPSLGRAASGPPVEPETGVRDRVILIERCSGIQVGRDNDQYSAYRVTLPTAALQSGQALADRLLSSDTPWSRDVFSHGARPDLGVASNGFGVGTSRIVAGPSGDTLVIVRNSRGVQVGDHNVQRNQFRIRVADVSVQANRLGATSARTTAISRLRDDPGDRAAARSLAEDVARAARRDLVVDLTAQVTRDVGHPHINRSSGEFHGLTGRQIGGSNRARVTVQVSVHRMDSRALQRQILKRAERDRRSARHDQPNVPPAGDLNRIHRSGPTRFPGPGGGRGVR